MKITREAINCTTSGFLTMALLALMASISFAQTPKDPIRRFNIKSLSNIDNPKAEFKVDLWTDRENATYKIGEKVTFFFKTDRDCRVTLLNIGNDGKVEILFPNEFHKGNQVKAGTIYTIPPRESKFNITAKPPTGEDIVKAIATLDKVDLIKDEDIIPVKGYIKGFKGVKKDAKILVIELEETLKPVEFKSWAETQKIIKVVSNVPE